MPELNWIGKQAVRAHHREVDFHLLKDVPKLACDGWPAQSSVRESGSRTGDCADHSGNLIVQGDNLLALKALLPRYAGQVKCIYIDPPYNTGNEGWVYNDNVKAPEIQKWLHQVVGKEAEDLSRHDKWLCMMYPRLQLLKRFLREDGSIWVSIGTDELAHLGLLMDEVFGATNRIAIAAWETSYTANQTARHISETTDYVYIYALNILKARIGKWERSDDQLASFKNPDNDPRGPWKAENLSAGKFYSAGQFEIIGPTGKSFLPPPGRYWRCNEQQYNVWLADKRITFGMANTGRPMLKKYREELTQGLTPSTWWKHEEFGTAKDASLELKEQFQGEAVFATPKPTRLLQRILQIATDKDSLVLDSFAGSGTTGHAVLKQNAEDGGTRRFILVEMEEKIARTITAERVRRVVMGSAGVPPAASGVAPDAERPTAKSAAADDLFAESVVAGVCDPGGVGLDSALSAASKVEPTKPASQRSASGPGSQTPATTPMPGFRFAVLGDTLFDAEGNIRETVRFEELAEFVWFQQTGAPMARNDEARMTNAETRSPLLGVHRGTAVYLLFNGILKDKSVGGGNVLTRPVLAQLPGFDGEKVIYGAACRMSDLHLRQAGVSFKQLPYHLEVNAWL